MKNISINLLAAVATLAIGAGTASAQVSIKVKVPFSFAADSRTVLPAGTYSMKRVDQMWSFYNAERRETTLLVHKVGVESHMTDDSKVVFHCRRSQCSLYQIQLGGGEVGMIQPERKRSKSSEEELAEFRVVTVRPIAE